MKIATFVSSLILFGTGLVLSADHSVWLTNVSKKDLLVVPVLFSKEKCEYVHSVGGKAERKPFGAEKSIPLPSLETIQFDLKGEPRFSNELLGRFSLKDATSKLDALDGLSISWFGSMSGENLATELVFQPPHGERFLSLVLVDPMGIKGGTHMSLSDR